MFNVGGGEILVILLVALVVLGPDKLPGAMRSVGNMIGELRKLSNGFQAEMRNAMYTDERPRFPAAPPQSSTSSPSEQGAPDEPPGDASAEQPSGDRPPPSTLPPA